MLVAWFKILLGWVGGVWGLASQSAHAVAVHVRQVKYQAGATLLYLECIPSNECFVYRPCSRVGRWFIDFCRNVDNAINSTVQLVAENSRCCVLVSTEVVVVPPPPSDLKSMVKVLQSKGITIKDEPGKSVVKLAGPGIGNEKVGQKIH